MIPVSLVNPEGGIEADAGVRGRHQVLHDIVSFDARQGCLDPVDLDVENRVVHALRDPHVSDALDRRCPVGDDSGDAVRSLQVAAGHLHVNGRRLALVERGGQQSSRVERELDIAEPLPELESELLHVLECPGTPGLAFQLDQHERVHRAGIGSVGRRPVHQYANVGNQHSKIGIGMPLGIPRVRLADFLDEERFDFRQPGLGVLDPSP